VAVADAGRNAGTRGIASGLFSAGAAPDFGRLSAALSTIVSAPSTGGSGGGSSGSSGSSGGFGGGGSRGGSAAGGGF
jgi:hypothetical protein